jgi:signal transduction histidine kinase
VILEAIDLINVQLKKSGIDMIFVLEDNIPKISGDRISLEQLIVNIILNARDAIIEKSEIDKDFIGAIRVTTACISDEVKVIIEDNGTGIPDNIIMKIWSPFFTTKKKEHGTGIGLSISSKILKEHKARAEVKTGKSGSTFIFYFPVIH